MGVACVGRVRLMHHSPLLHPSLKLAPWSDLGKVRGTHPTVTELH